MYAIGFSRGAASARHFLNLVDSLASAAAPIRSSALLFDTVATGQTDRLQLGIPASNELTVQIVATREFRFAFPYVPVQTDATDHPSLANGNSDRVVEVRVPGAHSDIGGGYDEGLWKLSLAMSRALLKRQGLAISAEGSASDAQAILNMGRHNSDWVKAGINGTGNSRSSVQIRSKNHSEGDIESLLDRHMRIARAMKRSTLPSAPMLMFKINRRGPAYQMTHNCQSRAFAFDAQARAITLDGKLFRHFSESQWQSIDTGHGILLLTEPEDPDCGGAKELHSAAQLSKR